MIVVVGSLNYDLTIHVERFPRPGEAVRGHGFQTACGGKGANQAYAVARMGADAAMLGCVGDDAFADVMLAGLAAVGADTSAVIRRPATPSGTAMILVDASGQNEIVIDAAANGTLRRPDVEAAGPLIRASRAVVAQLETTLEASTTAMRLGREAGALTVLNPAPYAPLDEGLLGLCDIVIPNESEASALAGMPVADVESAREAAAVLRRRGARAALVTLGANGVWVDGDGFCGHVPGFAVEAVDTVGAGDTFIGAFVVRMCEGAGLEEAARFGCAAAAVSVTRKGAQPSIPTRAEALALLTRP